MPCENVCSLGACKQWYYNAGHSKSIVIQLFNIIGQEMAAVVWEDDRGLTEDGVDYADSEVFGVVYRMKVHMGRRKQTIFILII